jgi:hypothetical protein
MGGPQDTYGQKLRNSPEYAIIPPMARHARIAIT